MDIIFYYLQLHCSVENIEKILPLRFYMCLLCVCFVLYKLFEER